ncbi:putative bifunctional epoxide hydrolase 2-like [Capsicum annuum]|uniref:epoxide hydrolase A isoform X1 n=1 Tax=Capsicum annuum TaxID=4072 RepID=UPI0007BF329D|nr:epoxide hydrolase A isoform X1 [Capsicum annuum]KAF3618431.1 putative bifunctional epoxide hydrolase 2-like [Capsicum annuum]
MEEYSFDHKFVQVHVTFYVLFSLYISLQIGAQKSSKDYIENTNKLISLEVEEEYSFDHKFVNVNGINMHVVEKGKGPVVLFIHGFPELWYSWRHQISFMAEHGYRAVAPDLRGYGDTTGAPKEDPSNFNILRVVGDLVELVNIIAPEQDEVFVVGHDWGAIIAWYLCLFRPDKVKALVNMSVPFTPRNPNAKPVETFKATYGDDFYIVRFQEPGDIEEDFAKVGTKRVLGKFLTYRNPGPLYLPFDDSPVILPSWLSEKDIDYYASKYEKTGFTGGLNYYRSLDLNWELTAAWTGAKVKVPVRFIVGDLDLTYNAPGVKDYINNGGMKKDVPLLEKVVILENVGHFLQQEKSNEINKLIHDFFMGFCST